MVGVCSLGRFGVVFCFSWPNIFTEPNGAHPGWLQKQTLQKLLGYSATQRFLDSALKMDQRVFSQMPFPEAARECPRISNDDSGMCSES